MVVGYQEKAKHDIARFCTDPHPPILAQGGVCILAGFLVKGLYIYIYIYICRLRLPLSMGCASRVGGKPSSCYPSSPSAGRPLGFGICICERLFVLKERNHDLRDGCDKDLDPTLVK